MIPIIGSKGENNSPDSSSIKPKEFAKLGRNVVYSIIGFTVSAVVLFLITPYTLNMIGKERFGIWAIMSVITTFAALTNFGFDQALVKFISEEISTSNIYGIKEYVSTAVIFFALGFGLICSVIYGLSEFICDSILNIDNIYLDEAAYVLKGIIISFYFRSCLNVFRAVIIGSQRFELDSLLIITTRILSAVGIFYFLGLGFGLKGLVYNNYLISFISVVLQIIIAKKLIGVIPFSFFNFSLKRLKKMFTYGTPIFFSSIFNMLQEPIIKVAVSNFYSISHVTYFEVGNRIPTMLKNFFASGTDVLVPVSAVNSLASDHQENIKIFLLSFRTIFILALPVFLILLAISKPFIFLWLGSGYINVIYSIYILLITNFLNLLAIPAVKIFYGIGKPNYSLFESILTLVALGIFIYPLSIVFQYYGLLLGILFTYIIGTIYLIYSLSKELDIKVSKIMELLPMKAMLVSTIYALIALFVSNFILDWSWINIILTSVLFFSFYFLTLYGLRLLNELEINLVTKILRNLNVSS